MMERMSVGLLTSLMLSSLSSVPAQSVPKPEPNNTNASAACDGDQGQRLIAQLIDETRKLTEGTLRVSVLAIIAERLWSYDEGGARAILQEADDLAVSENINSTMSRRADGLNAGSSVDSRFVVIEAVARHDKQWARRLIGKADEQFGQRVQPTAVPRIEHQRYSMWLLQQLALSLLATDPPAAIDFMRDSFRFPAAGQLPLFLFRLAATDQKTADSLYQEALQNYRTGDIIAVLGLSAYPFGLNQVVGRPLDLMPGGQHVPAGFVPNPNLQQAFLDCLFERVPKDLAAIARGSDFPPTMYSLSEPVQVYIALEELEPEMLRYQPALAEKAGSLRSSLAQALPPNWLRNAKRIIESADQLTETAFDARLASAGKQRYPALQESDLANAIFIGSRETRSINELRAIADRIADQGLRAQLLDWLYFQSAQTGIQAGNPGDAAELAGRVGSADRRAFLMYQIAAEKLKRRKSKSNGAELLEPITKGALKAPSTEIKPMALVGVSRLYAELGDIKSLEAMSSAIDVMNTLHLPDPALASIRWNFTGTMFRYGWAQKLDDSELENAFGQLAGLNFQKALLLARKISDRRSHAMAVMRLAMHCLQ